jgi:hypothetical protein
MLREGDEVEAKYKGRSRYYPGKISRVRLNGTYDIHYDDGERETGVERDLIRLSNCRSDSDSDESKFFRGDVIEARWRPVRRGAAASKTDEWFPAEVLAQHADDTYTVRRSSFRNICASLLAAGYLQRWSHRRVGARTFDSRKEVGLSSWGFRVASNE